MEASDINYIKTVKVLINVCEICNALVMEILKLEFNVNSSEIFCRKLLHTMGISIIWV